MLVYLNEASDGNAVQRRTKSPRNKSEILRFFLKQLSVIWMEIIALTKSAASGGVNKS